MKRSLRWIVGIFLFLLIGGGIGFAYVSIKTQSALTTTFNPPNLNMSPLIEAADLTVGERIVRIRNACIDCHGENLGGKSFIDDPAIGHFYAPNLTPYALKNWTDDDIAKAIRYGLNRKNEPLIFMPSMEYHLLSQSDLASIIAYLRSIPEVQSERKLTTIGPVAKMLFVLGKFPILASSYSINFTSDFRNKPDEAPTMQFGEYLTTTACVGCHGVNLTGGPIPGAPPEWAPASDIRLSQNSVWTEENFFKAMREGISPVTGNQIGMPMPIALTKQMNDVELKALWLYLKTK